MRPQTTQHILIDQQNIDIIQRTRQIIKDLSEAQRMEKAKKHLEDALAYRKPRPDTYLPGVSCWLRFIYRVQTSSGWSFFLFLISYLFMYLVILDTNQYFKVKIIIESIIITILWLDVFAEIYHKSNETLRISSKFQLRFYLRVLILILLTIDIIIFASLYSVVERPIRIFRILKGFLPIFYDHFTRKAFTALFSAYKDIIVYLFFYVLVIVSFALIGNQIIELPENAVVDQYTNNYGDFVKTIFIIYVLSTYDSYPDNQQLALQGSEYYYAFFITFIFLNVFFFVVIPATLIFNSFRQTRSKIILIDQIKQQHSLILCFVSLGEEDFNIKPKKLIRFLLYVYKNKVRYIDYIADVCLRLDDNNNGQIQISEFMNLCKILQANAAMMPPMFNDSQTWLSIKDWMDQNLKLHTIVTSRAFKIVTGIIILVAFTNSILFIATKIYAFSVIDDIVIGLFCLQILLKILGLGPQEYFFDKWNMLDFFLILFTLVLQFLPSNIVPRNTDVLSKMIRIFRVTMLLKAIIGKSKNTIYIKIRQLFGQMVIILPIVLKFFPMYLITYFIFGIVGMEAFYSTENNPDPASKYAIYKQFSHFNKFLSTQYIMVQILVEAGWSMLAFDHSVRFGHYVLVMLYFVSAHMVTVLILSSLLKGLVWQVYFTVHSQFQSRQQIQDMKQRQQEQIQQRKQELQMVKELIEKNVSMTPDTLIMKQLYENKIDLQIMKKLKGMTLKASRKNNKSRSTVLSHLMKDRQINADQIRIQLKQDIEQSSNHLVSTIFRRQKRQQEKSKYRIERDSSSQFENEQNESDDSHSIQDIQQLEQQIQKLITKTFLNPKVKYSEAIIYPKVFVDFLSKKLVDPFNEFQIKGFDIDRNSINNTQSLTFLAYELNSLLGIQKSQKEQKTIILQNMIEQNIINQEEAAILINKKSKTYGKNIDVNRVIRNTFLGQTNEALIKKFEIQYFSDIYGRSFKEINKVTLEPLIKYEATLTYCLRNLLRYPKLKQIDFFTILTTLQDSFSNKLLKKGSLFKFIYQLDSQSGTWFSVQLKQSKQVRIHFIKSGIWIYNKGQEPDQILYGRDLFNWDISQRKDKIQCQKFIQRLYQSFESLAFCLLNQRIFLASSPNTFVYDLFSFYTDVKNVKRNDTKRQYSISKVMLVILSKQEQRTIKQNKLQYAFQSFEKKQEKSKKKDIFKFDQTQDQTYNKLKRLQVLDQQKILQTEGLPFAFVLNLMKDIREMLTVNLQAITNQVQSIFNSQYTKANAIPQQVKSQNHHEQPKILILQQESKSQKHQPENSP